MADRYKLELNSLKKQVEFNFIFQINETLKNNKFDELSIIMQNYNEYVLTNINNYNFEMVKKNNNIIIGKNNLERK